MNFEEKKETLIKDIVERELAMFLATPNEGGVSACQTRPQSFRLMRWMNHCTHDIATLESYLHDLEVAEAQGRNFMIEKYARMDNRLPPLSRNPLLDEITDAEADFLREASRLYPHAITGNGDLAFRNYCRCELETLSDRTLELYATEVARARKEGRNLAVERYDRLWNKLGEGSLAAYEAKLASRR
ncbi:DUF4125 family protein [Mailhella sp.]|uniref:DUF4125 family protein n=1 Tax=Mailhella sp. TaxID=1981029 RepID=UPI003AB28431